MATNDGNKRIRLSRVLKFWKYGVTHSQVVLLGQKDEQNPTRVVFLLKAVSYISIPTQFLCNEVSWNDRVEEKEVQFLTDEGRYVISCDYVWFEEDELEFDDESPLIDERLF